MPTIHRESKIIIEKVCRSSYKQKKHRKCVEFLKNLRKQGDDFIQLLLIANIVCVPNMMEGFSLYSDTTMSRNCMTRLKSSRWNSCKKRENRLLIVFRFIILMFSLASSVTYTRFCMCVFSLFCTIDSKV